MAKDDVKIYTDLPLQEGVIEAMAVKEFCFVAQNNHTRMG